MSTCLQEADHDMDDFYIIEYDGDPGDVTEEPTAHDVLPRAEFTDRWLRPDPLTELLDELRLIGRPHEADIIERVLGLDDDEEAMRAYVSRQWADAWDSPEDSIYDQK